jgi:hypothetical protein
MGHIRHAAEFGEFGPSAVQISYYRETWESDIATLSSCFPNSFPPKRQGDIGEDVLLNLCDLGISTSN